MMVGQFAFGDRQLEQRMNLVEGESTNALINLDRLELAIIAESARWGDAKVPQPRTRDDDWLPQVDYLSMHLPKTPETIDLLNGEMIGKMKDGAVVVNTGRGLTVDAAAMKAALESGKIACYATDVWDSDPPSEDYPILSAPNVLMAPHLGASSVENLLRIGEEVVAHIDNFVGGK